MTSPPIQTLVATWMALGCFWLAGSPARGQEDAAAIEKKFKEVVAETREKVKACRNISSRFFHGGLENTAQWKEPWEIASTELADQQPKLRKAAIDWFLVNQKPDEDMLVLASQIALELQQERNYVLAKRVLVKLRNAIPKDVAIERDLALVCLKLNEFDRARDLLLRPDGRSAIESLEANVDKSLFYSALALSKKWERETKLREKDATAELPRVKLELPGGDVTIELFEDEAPVAVANFLQLIEIGYYDETFMHRVVEDLIAQGGGYNRRVGKVAVGYTIPDEMQLPDARHHFRGTVSMYNTGREDSADTEFFFCISPMSQLDWDGSEEDHNRYTVFGRVIEGMDAIDQLRVTFEFDKEQEKEVPIEGIIPEVLKKATVIRKRDHEYEYKKIEIGAKMMESVTSEK